MKFWWVNSLISNNDELWGNQLSMIQILTEINSSKAIIESPTTPCSPWQLSVFWVLFCCLSLNAPPAPAPLHSGPTTPLLQQCALPPPLRHSSHPTRASHVPDTRLATSPPRLHRSPYCPPCALSFTPPWGLRSLLLCSGYWCISYQALESAWFYNRSRFLKSCLSESLCLGWNSIIRTFAVFWPLG